MKSIVSGPLTDLAGWALTQLRLIWSSRCDKCSLARNNKAFSSCERTRKVITTSQHWDGDLIATGKRLKVSHNAKTLIVTFSAESNVKVIHTSQSRRVDLRASKMLLIVRVFTFPPLTTVEIWCRAIVPKTREGSCARSSFGLESWSPKLSLFPFIERPICLAKAW